MILNFFVLLTLLQFGLSYPDPNVEVGVNVRVDNDGNNCCKRDCNFGGVSYQHECHLKDTCINMQCIDGTWEYKGFKEDCGNCTFGREPVVYPFDKLSSSSSVFDSYWTGLNSSTLGEFVMAQPYFTVPAEFYVHSNIEEIQDKGGRYGAFVEGVTYHELGFTIKMTVPNPLTTSDKIKVFVNGIQVTIGKTVEYFYGTGGAILVFRHKHIITALNVDCISIVGTKGFSVTFCETENKYPSAYILATPSLRHDNSELHGLCNTWTGSIQNCFTEGNEHCEKNWWDGQTVDGAPGMYDTLVHSWNALNFDLDSTTTSSS